MSTDHMLSLESPDHPPEASAPTPILSLAGLAERSGRGRLTLSLGRQATMDLGPTHRRGNGRGGLTLELGGEPSQRRTRTPQQQQQQRQNSRGQRGSLSLSSQAGGRRPSVGSSGSAPSDSVRPKRVTVGSPKVVPPTLEGLLPERALKGRPSTLSPSEREPLTVSTAGSPSPRKGVRLSLGRSGSDIGAGTSEVVSPSSQHGGAFPFVDSSGHSDLDAMRRAITSVLSRQGSGASHGGLSQSFTSESAASRRESAASASGAANEELVTAAKIGAQLLNENEQLRQQVRRLSNHVSAMDRSPGQRLDASGRSSQQRRKSAFATMDSGLLSMGSLDEISEGPENDESDKARQEEEPREKGPSSRRGSLTTSSRQRMSVGEQQFIEELQEEVDRLQKQLRNANEDLRKLSNTMDTEEYKRLQERYEEKEAELAASQRQVNEHKRGEESAKRKNTELQQEIADLKEEHERALDRKRPEVVEAQRKAHEVTEELQRLKAVFEAKEREMTDDVKRAEQRWAEANQQALQLQEELNTLKSVLDDYNSKAAKLTNELAQLEGMMETTDAAQPSPRPHKARTLQDELLQAEEESEDENGEGPPTDTQAAAAAAPAHPKQQEMGTSVTPPATPSRIRSSGISGGFGSGEELGVEEEADIEQRRRVQIRDPGVPQERQTDRNESMWRLVLSKLSDFQDSLSTLKIRPKEIVRTRTLREEAMQTDAMEPTVREVASAETLERIAELERINTSLVAECQSLMAKLQEYQELKSQLEAQRREFEGLQAEKDKLEEYLKDLPAAVGMAEGEGMKPPMSDEERQHLQTVNEDLVKEVSALTAVHRQLQEQLTDLEAYNEALKRRLETQRITHSPQGVVSAPSVDISSPDARSLASLLKTIKERDAKCREGRPPFTRAKIATIVPIHQPRPYSAPPPPETRMPPLMIRHTQRAARQKEVSPCCAFTRDPDPAQGRLSYLLSPKMQSQGVLSAASSEGDEDKNGVVQKRAACASACGGSSRDRNKPERKTHSLPPPSLRLRMSPLPLAYHTTVHPPPPIPHPVTLFATPRLVAARSPSPPTVTLAKMPLPSPLPDRRHHTRSFLALPRPGFGHVIAPPPPPAQLLVPQAPRLPDGPLVRSATQRLLHEEREAARKREETLQSRLTATLMPGIRSRSPPPAIVPPPTPTAAAAAATSCKRPSSTFHPPTVSAPGRPGHREAAARHLFRVGKTACCGHG
ncbi:unnamed protein product [Vitrella brassicaformis CCMP3155]|uniref:Uncharacterized protein n=3 Tax=Vitrella brassicaformis TaxID=1169539 RepID=A0A0G4FRB7_VITBC|nr:unnamed protein product [Vitrella brassicaformis CCMP3155]|eukprot:CEM16777.1 unnamed protein product [Vitrella brassicaformis CCMP3155]